MIANYYTLLHIANDLRSKVTGLRLEEAFSQVRNELTLHCTNDGATTWILIGCEPSRNFLYCRTTFQRARRNSIDLFDGLIGKTIEGVEIHPSDRVIRIGFDSGHSLLVELFASKANVIQVDSGGKVMGAFLHPKDVLGRTFEQYSSEAFSQWSAPGVPTLTPEEFRQRLSSIGQVLLSAALKKAFPMLGSVLIKEVLFCAHLKEDTAVAQFLQDESDELYTVVLNLLRELTEKPQPCIYYDGEESFLFFIIPLLHLGKIEYRTFESIHDAIRTSLASSGKQKSFAHHKETLLQSLRQRIQRTERSIQKLRHEFDLAQHAAHNELLGKLLLAHIGQIRKGETELTVENVYSTGREMIAIPLQPALTAAKNAERYFEKAKKARRAHAESSERLANLNKEWEMIHESIAALESANTEESLRQFIQSRKEHLQQMGIGVDHGKKGKLAEQIPFRVFTVEGGFQVWVGKSSENNDLLTMKFAKPNDLWFHARGSSGSHVVLKIGTGKGEPSKRAIEQAAAIAAYYSKMRSAKNVPVAMTYRKYVRKPKGASAGTVTIEREKLLFVDPALPKRTAT